MGDFIEDAKAYLAKQGYPFEMYVAKKFRDAGFEVYQSTLYLDENENKEREIDVAAYYARFIGDIKIEFKVVIECKYTNGLWIFFSGENKGFETLPLYNFYCASYAGSELLEKLNLDENFKRKQWFKISRHFGYSLIEVKKENSNTGKNKENQNAGATYKAIMKLIGVLRDEYNNNAYLEQQGEKVLSILVPIIAVQGKLVECFLNEKEEQVFTEITEGQLLYKSNINPDVFPLIEVITKERIPELVSKLKSDFDKFFTDYGDILTALIENFPLSPDSFMT